jgi:hypothetical protein
MAWGTAILIVFACAWSIVAAPLSANKHISVIAELSSYWLALFVVGISGFLYVYTMKDTIPFAKKIFRYMYVLIAVLVVLTFWHLSTSRFIQWKMKSIPETAWPQMAADLANFGRQTTQSGKNYLPMAERPPLSLQRLGLGEDYKGGICNIWDSPEYKGVFAIINFGYKDRSWGLCLGPESRAKEYCRRGTYIAVASNAYFFCGPRD